MMEKIAIKISEELIRNRFVRVEVSARHVHLSQKDLEFLFGRDAKLVPKRELSQPNQYLCEQRVSVLGNKSKFDRVAVLGPVRSETQVELSRSDCIALGVDAPLAQSGELQNSAPITIEAQGRALNIAQAAIVAQAHVHMDSMTAAKMGLFDGQCVSAKLITERPVTLDCVLIRVNDEYSTAMHIDFDEANSAFISNFTLAQLIC